MSEKDPGPFAFPYSSPDGTDAGPGMTLRDYLAAKALPALIETFPPMTGRGPLDFTEQAGLAYAAADAMLKARNQ